MYRLPSIAPAGPPGSRWRLSDSLRDWLAAHGYRQDAAGVWECAPAASGMGTAELMMRAAESERVAMMMRAADLLDAEASRLERDMREARAEVKPWVVVREGGGDLQAAGNRADWSRERVLMTIFAYTELHALYLFALDFTQAQSPDHPSHAALPDNYTVPIADVLDALAWDEDAGCWDVAGAAGRLRTLDLGLYRVLPSQDVCLNDEELRFQPPQFARERPGQGGPPDSARSPLLRHAR
jgi:hypothetical protein